MSSPDFQALALKLSSAKHTRERFSVAGEILGAAGAQIRGGQQAAEGPLKGLSRDDVEGWLSVVDAEALKADLQRGAEAAFEAVLAESESEAKEFEAWALEALHGRDSLEAALVGLVAWEAATGSLGESGKRLRERLAEKLARVDAQGSTLARRLVGINASRRAARDRLAPQYRERAWWYSSRAECDDLAALWKSTDASKSPHCPACARDRDNAKLADQPPGACATEDELWMLDSDEMPTARRRLLEKHARACHECALALQAVAVPLFDSPETPSTPELGRPASAPPELVASRPEFKVLRFRGPNARLIVEPARGQRLLAAALKVGSVSASASVGAGGALELELKGASGKRGALRVELPGGHTVDVDVDI